MFTQQDEQLTSVPDRAGAERVADLRRDPTTRYSKAAERPAGRAGGLDRRARPSGMAQDKRDFGGAGARAHRGNESRDRTRLPRRAPPAGVLGLALESAANTADQARARSRCPDQQRVVGWQHQDSRTHHHPSALPDLHFWPNGWPGDEGFRYPRVTRRQTPSKQLPALVQFLKRT